MKKRFCWVYLLLLPLLLSGCQRKPTVGVCLARSNGALEAHMYAALEAAFHPRVLDARQDQARQNTQIDTLLEEGCDVLAVEPVMRAVIPMLKERAAARGVPLILLNVSAADVAEDSCCIGNDRHSVSRVQWQLLQALSDGGDRNGDGIVYYGLLGGPREHLEAAGWLQSCAEAFGGQCLGIECVRSGSGGTSACRRLLARTEALPEVIFCWDDAIALEALKALEEAELTEQVYLIGAGGEEQALQRIRCGDMVGTVCWDDPGLSRAVAQAAAAFIEGRQPEAILLKPLPVTAKTVGQ